MFGDLNVQLDFTHKRKGALFFPSVGSLWDRIVNFIMDYKTDHYIIVHRT